MAGEIRMTPDTMRQRSRDANTEKGKVENVIRSMDNMLEKLRGEWTGEAMKGYEERYNKIKPSLKNAVDLLDEISQNLSKTAQIIEETDRKIGNEYKK